jgi:hypothetical protein
MVDGAALGVGDGVVRPAAGAVARGIVPARGTAGCMAGGVVPDGAGAR